MQVFRLRVIAKVPPSHNLGRPVFTGVHAAFSQRLQWHTEASLTITASAILPGNFTPIP